MVGAVGQLAPADFDGVRSAQRKTPDGSPRARLGRAGDQKQLLDSLIDRQPCCHLRLNSRQYTGGTGPLGHH